MASGIIILMLGMSIIPSSIGLDLKESYITSASGNTLYVGGSGSGNYTKIQDAVDNASDGDTVFVYDDSSPYYENLVVDKSIDLVGENKNTTVIDGDNDGDVVVIEADKTVILGFTIQNSGNDGSPNFDAGIDIKSEYNTISQNIVTDNHHSGIHLHKTLHNSIFNNVITNNNQYGIHLYKSHHNNIAVNTVADNQNNGIYLYRSFDNIIADNIIQRNYDTGLWISFSNGTVVTNNSFWSDGIRIWGYYLSNWNTHIIKDNTGNGKPILYYKNVNDVIVPNDISQVILANCSNCVVQNINIYEEVKCPILLGFSSYNSISNNMVAGNRHAIEMFYSCYNIISENNFTDITWGIALYSYSTHNNITKNNIINGGPYGIGLSWCCHKNIVSQNIISGFSQIGLGIEVSWKNKVIQNTFTNNNCGVLVTFGSQFNQLYRNNFIENIQNAWDDGINLWYNPLLLAGNHWDDYEGRDIFPPWGRGDRPYKIPGYRPPLFLKIHDRFPLMNKYPGTYGSNQASQSDFQNRQSQNQSEFQQPSNISADKLFSHNSLGRLNFWRKLI